MKSLFSVFCLFSVENVIIIVYYNLFPLCLLVWVYVLVLICSIQ